MPKTIVREIDNTKTVGNTYSNFSVVIPGHVLDSCKNNWDSVADENGIYECSSVADFIKYIGKINSKSEVIAEAPVEKEVFAVGALTLTDAKTYIENKKVLYTRSKNIEGKAVGKFVSKDYIYSVIEDIEAEDLWDDDGKNIAEMLTLDSEGVNAQNAWTGNRIAYLLVQIGYTILYKNIGDTSTSKTEEDVLGDSSFWECLKDKSQYDFRYICTGGICDANAYTNIVKIAGRYNDSKLADWPSKSTENIEEEQGRGDVTALIDVDESGFTADATQVNAIKEIQSWVVNNNNIFCTDNNEMGKYAAIFAPHVDIRISKDADYGDTDDSPVVRVPATFYYLACAAKASENYAEWYPVAGYQRGVSDFTVVGKSLPLGEIAVQKLEPRYSWNDNETTRSVNVITTIRTLNNNTYLWGERTAHPLAEDLVASHFLNIRQLCSTLKKEIYIASKKLTFSPNDDILWIDFKALIQPILEKMKGDRGIKDYDLKRVIVNKKALMKAKIRIVPIEPVEDFNIGVYLEDSISGVSVDVDDE